MAPALLRTYEASTPMAFDAALQAAHELDLPVLVADVEHHDISLSGGANVTVTDNGQGGVTVNATWTAKGTGNKKNSRRLLKRMAAILHAA